MANVTVNISFQDALLARIDAQANRESRSRSELLREAARAYVRRQRQWQYLFALGDRQSARLKLTKADVNRAIRTVRRAARRTG
jgi:predicted transcriptional regulator